MGARAKRYRARLVAALALLLASLPFPAHGFCRSTTGRDNRVEGGVCAGTGAVLYWPSACVGYSIQRSASSQLSYEEASTFVDQAFKRWTSVTCNGPDGDGSLAGPLKMQAFDLGPVSCVKVGFRKEGANQNAITFRDDNWPHDASLLARTSTTFNTQTGEIYDTDIEINTQGTAFSFAKPGMEVAPGGGQYDFASVITHELGHFFGLGHSPVLTASMFQSYAPEEILKRALKPDDVAGICAIYGARPPKDPDQPTEDAPECSALPRGGQAQDTCPQPAPPETGCKTSGSQAGAPISGCVIAAITALAVRRRRRAKSP
jgi:uncharacterized protein (TIGR03382 family)